MQLGDVIEPVITPRMFWVVVIAAGLMVSSCAAPAAPAAVPTTLGMKVASVDKASQPSGPDKLPMEEIFPPGNGRDLVLNNCLSCHSIIRIVWGPRTEGEWQGVKLRHRDRVRALNDDNFVALFAYLGENFSPDKPYPRLPQWYLDSVTP